MKKIFIFLMTIIGLVLYTNNVYAETTSFYEGEYIPGIWMTKERAGTKYYQTARFFNRSSDNMFAYCTEPFAMFNETSKYVPTSSPRYLSDQQKEWITQIARYGYGYVEEGKYNHTDKKWYAITQFMIWQNAAPNDKIYFTDKLNGNQITQYTQELNEIRNIIINNKKVPTFDSEEYNILEGTNLTITDNNNVLNKFKSNNKNATINNNNLYISNLKEGKYEITLTKEDNGYQNPPIYYTAENTQELLVTGKNPTINKKIIINVYKTGLNITKVDSDTKKTIPQGEASLINAEYELLNNKMEFIKKLIINKDNKASIENIPYGTYYLKEVKSGNGYTIDKELHKIIIDEENKIINIKLENKVIERKIEIIKEYGETNNTIPEENITFEIYNNKGLYKSITTNKDGYAFVILPYGKYTIKQLNTTEGYKLIDDIKINVTNSKSDKYNLYDFKIKVPNTRSNDSNNYIIMLLIPLFVGSMHEKKKHNI